MPKAIHFFVSALFVMLLAGCDAAKFPIDNPAMVKVDSRLIGKWHEKDKKEKNPSTYKVSMLTDYKYQIDYKERKSQKAEKYTAYLSEISNSRFLNVYANEDSGFIFFRILDINPLSTIITIAPVKDTNLQYLYSAAEVRRYLTKNLDNPAIYGDTTYLIKSVK